MRIRPRFIVALFLTLLFSEMGPETVRRSVWRGTVFAQSALTYPIDLKGGSPGCTVLIPAVASKQVYADSGVLVIPAFGTGLSVQFLASTDTGITGIGSQCLANAVATRTTLSGNYVGSQAGTTASNVTVIPLSQIVTPSGMGLIATVSAGTGAQAVGGHFTFRQF